MAFGVGTGNTATGLALVRAVDPDSNSSAPDNHGVYSAVMCWKEAFRRSRSDVDDDRRRNDDGVGGAMFAICIIVDASYSSVRTKDGIIFRIDSAGLNIYKIS